MSGVIVVAPDELARIVREQVDAALADHQADVRPQSLLVSGAEMAELIDVSRATLHRLRTDEGCPAVKVGDSYKYEPTKVLAWLRGGRK